MSYEAAPGLEPKTFWPSFLILFQLSYLDDTITYISHIHVLFTPANSLAPVLIELQKVLISGLASKMILMLYLNSPTNIETRNLRTEWTK